MPSQKLPRLYDASYTSGAILYHSLPASLLNRKQEFHISYRQDVRLTLVNGTPPSRRDHMNAIFRGLL